MSFINLFSLPIHTPHEEVDTLAPSQHNVSDPCDNLYKPLCVKVIHDRTNKTAGGHKTPLEAGQVIPGDENEAGGGPQLHKDDPVHGAEGGGVTVLHAHTQRLYSLLQKDNF